MKDRILKIRKKAKLNQEDFAKRLNLTKNYISLIETGNRIPSDRTVSDICREFDINEQWLRTGDGEMSAPLNQDDRYSHNIGKLAMSDDETIIRWVNMIAETNPKVLKDIESFMKKLLDIEN